MHNHCVDIVAYVQHKGTKCTLQKRKSFRYFAGGSSSWVFASGKLQTLSTAEETTEDYSC